MEINNTLNNSINLELFNTIAHDSLIDQFLDNTFITFKSKDKILYLVYSSYNQSIISYNLNSFSIISHIKNAHNKPIINFRYHYYQEENMDLIMSISFDNNIKIWNIIQWKCIINLKNINDSGGILSGCFLHDKNDLYIISSCIYNSEQIKIYNLKGTKLKNIDESNENTYFIDTYYDKRQLKLYIIGGHFNCIKSYDYSNNKLYKKYYESYSNEHCSAIIFQNNDNILLIDSCCGKDKNIRIWNFHSAILIEKIFINTIPMGLCLLNEQYLFVGCMDKSIKLIDITEKLEIKYFLGHKTWICTIKIFGHQRLGKCLISQGRRNDNIIIWSIKD